MSDNTNSIKGEQLTFFQLFKEKKYDIEVPIIQRDYAQGRKESREIRNQFLDTLEYHLRAGERIDLDFVYGSLRNNRTVKFIPLDGQQRLTTLFLLHWYLANKDNSFQDFEDCFVNDQGHSRFAYEIRSSSKEFCDSLATYKIDLHNLLEADHKKSNSLSKTIRDLNWYYLAWDNDPTIKAMLTMLDSIHNKFFGAIGLFNKLTNIQNPVITFQFLNLDEFKLTDDLYIKMNSRGKQLTPFENFKAKFELFIKKTKFSTSPSYKLSFGSQALDVTVHEYFAHKIDTTWANLFWSYRDRTLNLFDDQLMNFIRVVATNHFAAEKDDKKLDKLKVLLGKDPEKKEESAKPISFYQYNEIEALDENLILNLISILDLISNGDDKIKSYLSDRTHYDESSVFEEVLNNSLNYTQRINFYAFYYYLIYNDSANGLQEWMRVIHNLSENTIYNSAVDFARSIKSVKSLLPYSSDILNYLASRSSKDIKGFLDIQVTEEIIKACLILKDTVWEDAISTAENHPYFKGQIGFILSFAGIQAYYNNNNACNWNDGENAKFFAAFNDYADKAAAAFSKEGVVASHEHIWERALLSKGDYLLSKNGNFSFLINADRDISWKRLLRDGNEGKRKYIRELFDDPNFNSNNVANSLSTIINQADVQDWRKYFIESTAILSFLGPKRYIRWNSPDSIFLLERQRMSGKHVEYYSYAYYLENLKGKRFLPFSETRYHFVSGEEESPYAVIDSWNFQGDFRYAINIYYSTNLMFKVKFFNRKKGIIATEVTDILKANGFNAEDNYFTVSKASTELNGFITSLCDSFQNLAGQTNGTDGIDNAVASTPFPPSPGTGSLVYNIGQFNSNFDFTTFVTKELRDKLKGLGLTDKIRVVQCGENGNGNYSWVYLRPITDHKPTTQVIPNGSNHTSDSMSLLNEFEDILNSLDKKIESQRNEMGLQ